MNFLTASVDVKVDDSQVAPALNRTKSLVTRTATRCQNIFKKMSESFSNAWNNMGRNVKIAAAVITAGLGLMARAAMKQQDAQFLLMSALKISGEYTKELGKDFMNFAASIQKVTIYADEDVLALMQLQKSLGVTADKLELAAKQAIGLATATGRDIRSMSMYIALAQQGEFTMLRRYIPALRSTTDETEQLQIITEFAAAGFELAQARAETASGSLIQMKNALGDAAEKLGFALLPSLTDLGKSLTETVQKGGAFQEFIQTQVEGLTAMVEAINYLDQRLKERRGKPPMTIPQPVTPPKEWYLKHPEKIGAGIKAYKDAGVIPPEWMWQYMQRAEEGEALKKAASEYSDILTRQASPQVKEADDAMLDHRRKMAEQGATIHEMEYRMSVQKVTALMEEQAQKEAELANRRKRIAEDIAMSMAQSWSNAIDQMMFEGKKFWDAMSDMARSLMRSIAQIIMYKAIAEPIAYGIMRQPVPSAQHGGEVMRTGLAVIHKGERYSGVGKSLGDMQIHIHNEGSEKLGISDADYDFKNAVLNITTQAAQTNSNYRRSHNIGR